MASTCAALSQSALEDVRGDRIGMIFQEPLTSLNPVMTIGDQIAEGVRQHRRMSRGAARRRAVEMLTLVRMPDPERRAEQYPHQLSGGMRQRAMIALALACEPRVLVADEPTTALDVTIQAQILGLIRDLQQRLGTALVLITHDLGVVAEMADQVIVMYAGRRVEVAPSKRCSTARSIRTRARSCRPRLTSQTSQEQRRSSPKFQAPCRLPGNAARLRLRAALPVGCRALPRGGAALWSKRRPVIGRRAGSCADAVS